MFGDSISGIGSFGLSQQAMAAVIEVAGFLDTNGIAHGFWPNRNSTHGMGSGAAAVERKVDGVNGIPLFCELTTRLLPLEDRSYILVCHDASNRLDDDKIGKFLGSKVVHEDDPDIHGLVNPFRLQYGKKRISRVLFDQAIIRSGHLMCTNAGTPECTAEFSPALYHSRMEHISKVGDFTLDKGRFYVPVAGQVGIIAGPPAIAAGTMSQRVERLFSNKLTGGENLDAEARLASFIREITPSIYTVSANYTDRTWLNGVPSYVRETVLNEAQAYCERFEGRLGAKVVILADNYLSILAPDLRFKLAQRYPEIKFLFLPEVAARDLSRKPKKPDHILILAPDFIARKAYSDIFDNYNVVPLTQDQQRTLDTIRRDITADPSKSNDRGLRNAYSEIIKAHLKNLKGEVTVIQGMTQLNNVFYMSESGQTPPAICRPMELCATEAAEICLVNSFPVPEWVQEYRAISGQPLADPVTEALALAKALEGNNGRKSYRRANGIIVDEVDEETAQLVHNTTEAPELRSPPPPLSL